MNITTTTLLTLHRARAVLMFDSQRSVSFLVMHGYFVVLIKYTYAHCTRFVSLLIIIFNQIMQFLELNLFLYSNSTHESHSKFVLVKYVENMV